MTTKLPPVDIIIIGMGWTGGILAKELGPTGLKIVVLERGAQRSTQNDFAVPLIRDALRGITGEVGSKHLTDFANALSTRMSAVQPELKHRYLGAGGVWFDDEDADAITPEGSLIRA